MKLNLIVSILFLFAVPAFAQINIADSTVQVICYWDKGEKQLYSVSNEKIKVKGTDTTSKEMTTYDVEITVLDSSASTYTVQWLYSNIVTDNENPLIQKLMNITKGMKVIFKTDEFGVFEEVVNWKEIRDYNHTVMANLRTEFKSIPEMDKLLKQIESTYSSKEAIEASTIKDIQQFHVFHGAKYDYQQLVEGSLKTANIFGGDPFDTKFSVYLDEINEEDNNYILRSAQEVNREQLTKATFKFMTEMAKNLKVDPPKESALGELKNETLVASRIHGTGWVVYSISTSTITTDSITNIEERVIEIK